MPKNKKTEFFKSYNKLPESIQDFLASDKMEVIINDALNLGKVSSERFFSIMDLITEVLFLELAKERFRNELERRINISPVAAQIIDKVIETKIFKVFEEELNQYKPQPLEQKVPQEKERKRIEEPIKPSEKPIESLEMPKIKPVTKEKVEQTIIKQSFPEQIIPKYSFPEPSEVIIEKPVNKTEEFKRIITPKIPLDQQEKIREKLLAAMQKENGQPKIIEKMKKVSLNPQALKKTEEREAPKRIGIGKLTSSQVLSGEGEKFKDEESFVKTSEKKPYILDTKLKEEPTTTDDIKNKQEKIPEEEPIPYKKYQKKSPFGEA